MIRIDMWCKGWLRLVGSLQLWVSFAEYRLYCRALLQKRPIILRSLLVEATLHDESIRMTQLMHMSNMTHSHVSHAMHMTHSHVYRDMAHLLHTCDVTWLIHMCDMTHSYVWHDSPASGWSAAPWALCRRANSRTYSACAAVPFWLSSRNPWRLSPRFCRAVPHTPAQKWVQIAEHVQRVKLFLFLDSSRNLWCLSPRVCRTVTHTDTHTHTHTHTHTCRIVFQERVLIPQKRVIFSFLRNKSDSHQKSVTFCSEMSRVPFRNELYSLQKWFVFHFSRCRSEGEEEQGNKTHFWREYDWFRNWKYDMYLWYGVATISRLLKIIGLFCKILSLS